MVSVFRVSSRSFGFDRGRNKILGFVSPPLVSDFRAREDLKSAENTLVYEG